jgi:hypothetical protein
VATLTPIAWRPFSANIQQLGGCPGDSIKPGLRSTDQRMATHQVFQPSAPLTQSVRSFSNERLASATRIPGRSCSIKLHRDKIIFRQDVLGLPRRARVDSPRCSGFCFDRGDRQEAITFAIRDVSGPTCFIGAKYVGSNLFGRPVTLVTTPTYLIGNDI